MCQVKIPQYKINETYTITKETTSTITEPYTLSKNVQGTNKKQTLKKKSEKGRKR